MSRPHTGRWHNPSPQPNSFQIWSGRSWPAGCFSQASSRVAYRGGHIASSEHLGTSMSPPVGAAPGPSATWHSGVAWGAEGAVRYTHHVPRTSSSQAAPGQPGVLPTRAPSRIASHDAEMSFPARRWREQMRRQQVGLLHMRRGETRFTPTAGIAQAQLSGGLCVIFSSALFVPLEMKVLSR